MTLEHLRNDAVALMHPGRQGQIPELVLEDSRLRSGQRPQSDVCHPVPPEDRIAQSRLFKLEHH